MATWDDIRKTPQQNGWDSIRNFVSSAGSALGTPIVKSLANIGALGANTLGNVQMALNKPESALKSYDRALAARQYAGTEGSFDQGFKSGAGTLVKGGLSALQTALTASGLKYITPAKLATTGLIGGGFSKVMGGDFSTGAGQAVGSLPQILGFVGASNPILAKYLPKNSQIPDRILGAGGNVIQGIGMDLARGTPTTPLGVGIDLVTGAMGGTSQFDMPNVKGLNPDVFVSDKNILNEAKQQLRTGIELDPFSKLGKDLDNMYKNYGLASYPNWNKLSIEERVNVLDDRVSEMAKQWGNNVKMGITDDKPIKTGGESISQNKLYSIAEEFDNPEDFIAHYRGSATQYNKYTPEIRKYGTTENSTRISDLGIDPNRKITIYRGIDDVENKVRNPKINDGDFVTTDKESAGSYTGGTIVSKEVRAKDLITDFPDEFDVKDPFYTGAEFIYSDSKNKLIKYTDNDLRNIFEQSKKLGLNQIKQNSAEASKSLAYKNKYGFFKMGDKLVNDIETKIKSSYPEDYFIGENYNKLGELVTKELDNIVSPVKSQLSPESVSPIKTGSKVNQPLSQLTLKEINQFKEVPHLGDFRSASRPADEILDSFQAEASKWTKGVEPEGKLNAYQLASDNWKLRRRLLKEQFGDWTGTTTVYRVGPATDDITSVFSDKNIAESYAKRMGVESINEFKAIIDDLVPSQSGSGELFVDKNSLIQSQPIKTGEVKPLFDKWVKDYDVSSLKKGLEIVEQNPKLREESIKNLPNRLTVYKAIQEGSDTPSWTIDKGLAERWAENSGRELESMKISKSDIGYYLGGPESELFLKNASKEITQPIKTGGEINSPSITSNRPDLTNKILNKGFGEIDDLHTIDPKTGKLISKPQPIKTGVKK